MAAFRDEVYIQNIAPVELAHDRVILSEILICQIIQDMKVTPQMRALQPKADCVVHPGFV